MGIMEKDKTKMKKTQKTKLFFSICNKCGAICCKPTLFEMPYNLNLKPGDFSKIINIGYYALLNVGHDVTRGEAFVIHPHIFGHCPFLKYNTNSCTIYDIRPKMCSVFPYDPRSKEKIKEKCLILKTFKKDRLKEIQKKLSEYYDSTNFKKMEEKKQELDLISFRTQLAPFIKVISEQERYLNNSWGSFVFHTKLNVDISYANMFFKLIDSYSTYFKQEEVVIKSRIVTEEPSNSINILGVFSQNKTYDKYLIKEYLKKGDYYFTEVFDGSFLEGVIFDYELKRPPSSWEPYWDEMTNAIREFKSRNEP
jgi:Fe-S-cluster containining protein